MLLHRVFSGFGLSFRDVAKTDLKTIILWRNSPKVLPYMDDQRQVGAGEMEFWFNRQSESATQCSFMAERGKGPVGFLELKEIDRESGSAKCGIFMNPDLLNAGLAMNMFLLRESILCQLNIGHVISNVIRTNTRSMKFQLKFNACLVSEDETSQTFMSSRQSRAGFLKEAAIGLGYEDDYDLLIRDWLED